MPASESTPPSRPPEPSGVLVLRFGTALGLAAAAALASTFPAATRVAGALAGAESTLRVWTAVATAALGPMLAAVVVLRGAREGLRAFGGSGAELRAVGAVLWLASLFVGLAMLGGMLRATTHNHALAGVTFAFGAVALALGAAAFCARVVAILGDSSAGTRRALVGVLGGVAVLAVAWTLARFARAVSHDAAPSTAASTVLDLLAFALAAVLTTNRSLVARRWLALVGPPIAVVIAAAGLSTMRDTRLCDAIAEYAPTFAPAVSVLRVR